MSLLRELGIRQVVYIDDILVKADSEAQVRDYAQTQIFLLEPLGPDSDISPREDSEDTNTGNRIPEDEHPLTDQEASNPATKGKASSISNNSSEESDNSHSERSVTPPREKIQLYRHSPGRLCCQILQRDLVRALEWGEKT